MFPPGDLLASLLPLRGKKKRFDAISRGTGLNGDGTSYCTLVMPCFHGGESWRAWCGPLRCFLWEGCVALFLVSFYVTLVLLVVECWAGGTYLPRYLYLGRHLLS
ncbi:hypothetical protein VTN31DRAFT_3624 [Thermomyces dupontii]|uniref:uncharacterized protein n=1 Tax=Talaromyces thermophilus TaxID=28565 RepID=UPI0037443F1A